MDTNENSVSIVSVFGGQNNGVRVWVCVCAEFFFFASLLRLFRMQSIELRGEHRLSLSLARHRTYVEHRISQSIPCVRHTRNFKVNANLSYFVDALMMDILNEKKTKTKQNVVRLPKCEFINFDWIQFPEWVIVRNNGIAWKGHGFREQSGNGSWQTFRLFAETNGDFHPFYDQHRPKIAIQATNSWTPQED